MLEVIITQLHGGTGNPGGKGTRGVGDESVHSSYGSRVYANDGTIGTGGLLLIYANNFYQSGLMQSCGTQCNMTISSSSYGFGGSSGGGSVNVFYKNKVGKKGKNNALGGGATLFQSYKGRRRRKWLNNNRKYLYRNICERGIEVNVILKKCYLYLKVI